jgi:hypothetical protein
MKFLRISEGKSIKADAVEALESIDQLNTRIYMQGGSVYEAMLPYEALAWMLEIEEESPAEQREAEQSDEILRKLSVLSKDSQFFAG